MMPRLGAVIAAIAILGMASAHAEPAFSTADVNMRAGPDVDFPPVAVIPEGEEVYIKGCLRDESWCDVVWEEDRGWVYSEYLALDYRGELMPLPDVGLVEFR
ncbi:MAG: SH3 domain-containing protein, partial [Gammaproteobacteria bacterium]